MVRRSLPLHRQVKNVYRKNKYFQAEIIRLKKELQQSKEHIVKRNMDLLAQESFS
jgi:peptidoglycan hydrolase CwlO-like protein